ncbi:MAG: hypothetical protein RLZZ444_659 [Pseudomonadota bacterium]|jgi:diguanylate cyclase (GGDEF)-like protein/PAS domain S-box-containing protein
MAHEVQVDNSQEPDLYRRIFEELSEAIIGTDVTGTIIFCNKASEAIFGWKPEELIGQRIEKLIPQRYRAGHGGHMAKFKKNNVRSRYMGKAVASVTGIHRDGHEIDLGTTIMQTIGNDGKTVFVAAVRDISLRMQYMQQVEKYANTDPLTGLSNRRHFFEELKGLIENPEREETRVWLGLFDLDGFKAVNDIYGHQAGDLLLQSVARRIAISLPEHCLLARLGGDEFAVAVPGPASASDIDELGHRIIAALRQPYDIEGSQITIGASGGFAHYPDMATTVSALYERADYSLYIVKHARSGGINVFNAGFQSQIEQKSRMEYCLRKGDLANELYLEFQPIIDLVTNRISHFEALARWANPELGLVSPAQFVPLAERCGKINEITRILFQKALDEAVSWPEDVSLSFNLSAQDILSRDSVFALLRMIMRSGLSPARIEFEITETSILTDFDQADLALRNLAAAGCRIALDDFGSGYSSYGYMDRLMLHKIKMDRSFVSRLNTGPKALKVIKAIADFATSLELDCVAEGVETLNELEQIRSLKIPHAQGYIFSRPVDASKIPVLLQVHNGFDAGSEEEPRRDCKA